MLTLYCKPHSPLLPQLQVRQTGPRLYCSIIRLGTDQPSVISPPVCIISHCIWFKALFWWCCWGEEKAGGKKLECFGFLTLNSLRLRGQLGVVCELQDQIFPETRQKTRSLQMQHCWLKMTHCFLILVNPVSMLEWIYKEIYILPVMLQI